MKLTRLTNGTSGIVTAINGEDCTVEAPDFVEVGYEKVGEVWQKSAALLARESNDLGLDGKRLNLTSNVATLRTWATDSANASANWNTRTTTQRDVIMTTLLARMGTLCDRLADLGEVILNRKL